MQRVAANTDDSSDQYNLFHRKVYLEVIDTISSTLCSRFETEAKEILQAVENFLVHNNSQSLNHFFNNR